MNDAIDDGAITMLPFARRMNPKKGHAEISALDETEIAALFDYLGRALLGPITHLALTAGAIEVLRLQHVLVMVNPWKPDTFSNEFLRAVRASGLPKVTFHGWRHSYASISLRAGTPLKVVSEMLGHTTTAITADLYKHVLGNLKAQAADRSDAVLQSAEKRHVVRKSSIK